MYERLERVHVVEGVGLGAEGTPADLGAEGGCHGIRGALGVKFVVSIINVLRQLRTTTRRNDR